MNAVKSDIHQELQELKKILQQISGNPSGVYIENSFQMPNFITDFLDYYLTPVESKVLYRIVREILGWQRRITSTKNIVSLLKIQRGYRTPEGTDACLGCGLSYETIETAVEQLCAFRILTKEQRTQKGCIYRLNFNTSDYDIAALQARAERKKHNNRNRMQQARKKNPKVNPEI